MEVYFLIAVAIVIAWILIRAAGGGRRPDEVSPTERAGGNESAVSHQQWVVRDPVCGAVGPVTQASATAEHAGQRFHFCSERCRDLFVEHPHQYISSVDLAGETSVFEPRETEPPRRLTLLDWRVVALALASFFALTYVLSVLFGLLFPQWAMYELWGRLLPGFTWLSWGSFLVGLVGSVAYGFYIALVFCPLFNLLSRRLRERNGKVQGAGEGI